MKFIGYCALSVRFPFFSRNEFTQPGEGVVDAGTFDEVLRRAAKTIDRRGSLKILGGGLAGSSATLGMRADVANAGKNGKGNQKCRRQRGQCLDFVQRRCEVSELSNRAAGVGPAQGNPECVADFNPCCDYFGKCQAKQGLECLTPRRAVSE